MKKRKITFLTRLLVFTVILAIISNTILIHDLFGRKIEKFSEYLDGAEKLSSGQKDVKEESIIKNISYTNVKNDTSDVTAYDSDTVFEAISKTTPYTYIDFTEEYDVVSEVENGNGKTYRLNQIYDNIPVDGYGLIVDTDKNGYITGMYGKYVDLSDFGLELKIDKYDAEEYVEKYIENHYGTLKTEFDIDYYSKGIAEVDKEKFEIGYFYDINFNDGTPFATLFVSAKSGDVLKDISSLVTDRVEKNLNGQKVNQTLYVNEIDSGEYELSDYDTKFKVIDAKGASNLDIYNSYENGDAQVISWKEKKSGKVDKSSVDALANLERVYSFYKEVFKREGLENDVDSKTIPVFANISKYIKGNNSYSDFTNNAGICGTSIIFVGTAASGKTTKSQYLDVMGHEFTHGVIFDEVKLYAKGTSHEFDAMNEGLADIFGEFAEDYLDDKKLNNTCNWVHGEERSFIKPEKKQKMVASDYNNNDDVHYGTYIMAHPVYLMNNGIDGDNDKKISNEKLAYMYYDAIVKMWAYNGFSDFRKIIEGLMYLPGENGDKYSLTEKQKECIIDAMDSVGIERDYDYSLTPNAELNIYDINDNPCENVEVSIFTPSGLAIAENDKVKDGVYKLNNINPGIYRIVVYDENGDNKSYSAVINDNEDDPVIKYSDNDSIYTQFGGVTGNIELVLDVSDSMYGKPIECLKESALNFANVLYALAPFAKVDLIVYSTDAELVLTDITSEEELGREIKMIQTGGSTNMYDGLELTGKQLEEKKDSVIVVMSDGMPCEGECIDDDYNTPVINLAEKIKKRGAKIYSFGFFHNIAGEELKEGQELMESIASDKNSFSVTDINSSHLSGVFTSIAEQISHPGDNIHIEVHCPVDVEVSLNGKVLISSKDGILGSGEQCLLTFSGEDNEEKILNLKKGPDYKICITGYDKGTMDYSIAYTDENGDYIDERKFKDIEITDETLITTDASETKETELKVDENGDGNYDRIYRAKENSKAKEKFNILGYTKWIYALAYVIFLIISMVVGLKNGIKNKINDGVCRGCGEKNPKGALFCSSCGMKMINAKRGKKTTGAKVSFIVKIAVVLILSGEIAFTQWFNETTTVSAYKDVKSHEYPVAKELYHSKIKNNKISNACFKKMMLIYIDKLKKEDYTTRYYASMAIENMKIKGAEFKDIVEKVCPSDATEELEETSEETSGETEKIIKEISEEIEDATEEIEETTEETSEEIEETTVEKSNEYSKDNILDISASSILNENSGISYSPFCLNDGDIMTAWCEGVYGEGYGEYIDYTFAEPCVVKGIKIYNGYQKDIDSYLANARPECLCVVFSDGEFEYVYLDDEMGCQNIEFDSEHVTDSVRIEIAMVYEGDSYEDTLISEIDFY